MTSLISTPIAARDTVNNILAFGGSTLSLIAGVPPVTTGYAVSLPDHESKSHLQLDGPLRVKAMVELVELYIESKRALLTDPVNHLGAWLDGDTLYLDITQVYTEFATAVRLGWERKQLAIYDLSTGTEIRTSTGGHGRPKSEQQSQADLLAYENHWSASPFEIVAQGYVHIDGHGNATFRH